MSILDLRQRAGSEQYTKHKGLAWVPMEQQILAARLGVDVSTVRRWEKYGMTPRRRDNLQAIAELENELAAKGK